MKALRFALLATAIVAPAAAAAADDIELRALRDELAQLRASYEQRIGALEQRLLQAEQKAAAEPGAAVMAAPPPAGARPGSNAFNPDLSLILSGLYSNLSTDPAGYRITGFHLPGGPLADITPRRGLSLAESELGVSANVDQSFYGALNLAIHPDNSLSSEEAYLQTTALPQGLTLKAGRFFSGIGYLNEQHAHAWDFVDMPLAYQAFLGGQFNDDGLQLRWLAPSDSYLELGAELGRGANYPGTGRDKNGAGASTLFAHAGGDIGDSNSWRAGVSALQTSPRDRRWDDRDAVGVAVSNGLSGSSRLLIADGVWKWAPNGNANSVSFKLQGEYLRRQEHGQLSYDIGAASRGTSSGSYAARQSGWYLQGVYQFAPYWRVGLRSERLDPGVVDYGSNNAMLLRPDYAPARNALMVDYNPSEFARMRLQFSEDRSRQGITDNQLFLQYLMCLGAHGAHKF